MKSATSRLPAVVGAFFLAGDGFLGYRCAAGCPFVATGRTPEAVDAGMVEHHRYVHEDAGALIDGDVDA